MRLPILLATAVLLTATACESATLSGTWGAQTNTGGGYTVLYLGVAGSSVDGSAFTREVAPLFTHDTLSISGVYRATAFNLTLMDRTGLLIRYVGDMVGQNELRGTWAIPPDSGVTAVFYRE